MHVHVFTHAFKSVSFLTKKKFFFSKIRSIQEKLKKVGHSNKIKTLWSTSRYIYICKRNFVSKINLKTFECLCTGLY